MELPKAVQTIIHLLERNGYEAYAVGGCVRDLFLHRVPKDWDVTTSAPPEAVKGIFHRTVDTGIKHGTVTVLMGGEGYEVTTYRIDGVYSDFRHPEDVHFTTALEEDLKRRDFTINAMAYDGEGRVVDLFGGRKDLQDSVIRAVGVAEERFTEDALRILRAFRFSAELGFTIEEKTLAAAGKLAGNLRFISRERVREELTKLLVSPHPDRIRDLYRIGAINDIYPAYPEEDGPLLAALNALPPDPVLRYAALFYCGADRAEERAALGEQVITELRFDNATKNRVVKLLALSDTAPSAEPYAVRCILSRAGEELFPLLVQLLQAVSKKEDPVFDEMLREGEAVIQRGECISVSQLKINGTELLSLGTAPGKAVGETLKKLLEEVLKAPEKNEKETLAALVSAWNKTK